MEFTARILETQLAILEELKQLNSNVIDVETAI